MAPVQRCGIARAHIVQITTATIIHIICVCRHIIIKIYSYRAIYSFDFYYANHNIHISIANNSHISLRNRTDEMKLTMFFNI